MSKKWKIGLAISGLVAALVIGGASITGSVLAQEMDPPPEGETPPGPPEGGRQGEMARGRRSPRRGGPENAEVIAEALGLTVEELEAARDEGMSLADLAQQQGVDISDVQAAMEAARQAQLEQAVEDGRLSEEEAEQILEDAPPAGWQMLYHDQMEEALADALGLSVDELEAARAEDGRLHEALGIDVETFHQAMEAAHSEIVEQAIADGVLTEAQAEGLSSRPGHGGRGGGMCRGNGPGRMRSEGGRGGRGAPTAPPASGE